MIIRYAAVVGAASGTLGAITFSNRRGNAIVSTKSTPNNQATQAQMDHRIAMARAAKGWAAQTPSAMFNWKLFAAKNVRQNRLGVTRQLSAYQFYIKENVLRAQIGATLHTIPPTLGQRGIGQFAGLIFYVGGPYQLVLNSPTSDPDGWYAIYGARSGRTVSFGKKYPRLVYAEHVTDSFNVDLYTPWTDIFGPMPSGEIYWLAVRYLGDNSIASAPASLTQIVF
jgi:hypothetical protein